MEAIKTLYTTSEKMLANAKKDSQIRKTPQYMQEKLNKIEEIEMNFEDCHKKIMTTGTHNAEECQQICFKTQSILRELRQYLAKCPKAEETPPEKPQSFYVKEDEILDNKVQWLRKDVQLLKEDLKVAQEAASKGDISLIRTKKAMLEECWRLINAANQEIKSHSNSLKYYNESNTLISTTRQTYYEVLAMLEQEPSRPSIKLEPIKIPKFDGKYENWTSFFDMFNNFVHFNKHMSNVEKMQYLKTNLEEEPAKLIQHLQTTDANYNTAWELLQSRYNNKRLITKTIISRILDLPTISQESAEHIKRIHDTTIECLKALQNIGIDTETWGPIVSEIITRKWDPETNKIYEQSLKQPHDVQKFEDITAFLQGRFQSLESISMKRGTPNSSPQEPNHKKMFCKYCQSSQHYIAKCPKFMKLSIADRNKTMRKLSWCVNCLRHDSKRRCESKDRCAHCKRFHHTLLHIDQESQPKSSNVAMSEDNHHETLLATAIIKIRNVTGTLDTFRALIDSGSQTSFISEEAAQLLRLPREKICAEITGIGDGDAKTAKSKITAEIHPRFRSNFKTTCELLVMDKITSAMPQQTMSTLSTDSWKNDYLADPTYHKPGPIDVLLGVAVYTQIMQPRIKKLGNHLLAQQTELGWTLCGNMRTQPTSIQLKSMISRSEEDKLLTRFWETEEVDETPVQSTEHMICEELYSSSTKRDKEGRYVVRIPFKDDPTTLGESKPRAAARFFQLERKLKNNTQLASDYKKFMQEYLELGHMKLVKNPPAKSFYIPHQAVIKTNSTTTKLRVVFDASCKSSNGKSLNMLMHTGPRLQDDLADILLRWRLHRIAFVADVEKMYRQIWVHEDDQKFQSILWRFSEDQPLQTYQLTTVTYGTASAPYLAIRTLQEIARNENNRYPNASKIAQRDFYVDDVLTGADNIEEAILLQNELVQMLMGSGFKLRKWCSNSKVVIQQIPEEDRDQNDQSLDIENIKRSLGILWNPNKDVFSFKVDVNSSQNSTKREILAEIAKLFDPLGWISPIIIMAKLIMRELWMQKLDWDTPVPEAVNTKWITFRNDLKNVENMKIPRWVQYSGKTTKSIQLHGFADSSEQAYGAVIYVRTETEDGQIQISLLTSKSKVAPIKMKKTLPRLELCAAVLLAKLMSRTTKALNLKTYSIFAWTDSMIALAWIKGDVSKWKTFVANRVAEITAKIPSSCWRHVSSEQNPADLVSRGIEPSKLQGQEIWWVGPHWLSKDMIHWPKVNIQLDVQDEKRNRCLVSTETHHVETMADRFSTLEKLTRVTVYCLRFIQKCKNHSRSYSELAGITSTELEKAMEIHCRQAQAAHFKSDILTLKKDNKLHSNSKLLQLNAFLDKNGVLRVGGRIEKSSLTYNEKHPIIIPKDSHLATLILRHAHSTTLHGGNQLSLAFSRRKYWIINGKRLIKNIISKCTKCIRFKGETAHQIMGELPEARVKQSFPFLHSGIDYAGPFHIRAYKGRGHKTYKGYIAIFVCLSTKALHIEVVSDLGTDAFLAACRRFMSRRGSSLHMYSDNGSNFVGAARLLSKEIKSIIQNHQTQEKMLAMGINWHFNPPAAPHQGGIWESAVKSMKHHLRRVIGESTLTFEEMTTLTTQIEACLNSRPLWPLSTDPNQEEPLTPGHFLIGRPIITPYCTAALDVTTPHAVRWKLIQKMKKDFWNKWSHEYLHTLQCRYKWKQKQDNLETGDMVIMKEENSSPGCWPLAKIAKVYRGNDGNIRVVEVQQAGNKTLKRPITKIIPLKINHNDEQQPINNCKTNLSIMRLLMSFFIIIHGCTANYTIKPSSPGLYIEHIGSAFINRGTFKLDLQFPEQQIWTDHQNVNRTINEMEILCHKYKETNHEILCDEYLHHLRGQYKELQWTLSSFKQSVNVRQRRGILGKFLTTIFGVNDEVYQDIDSLQENQKELVKLANHQTKLTISTITTLNETEQRINQKLNNLTESFNHGVEILSRMQSWYAKIDENKLNIFMLQSFTLAKSYIEEVTSKWTRILGVMLKHRHIYELLPSSQVKAVINDINNKLPSSLEVIQEPVMEIIGRREDKAIHISTYFFIQEIEEFSLSKVTAIPSNPENDTLTMLVLPDNLLAINFNSQLYFEVSNHEFEKCKKKTSNSYLCTPKMVQHIETNPNCIIDIMFHRQPAIQCPAQIFHINQTIWKPLIMQNTWLCITPRPVTTAIICNGLREEVIVNTTSMIQTSSNCTIHTMTSILTSRLDPSIKVNASYFKSVKPPEILKNTMPLQHLPSLHTLLQDHQANQWNQILTQEQDLKQTIADTTLKSVRHHSIITSGITIIVFSTTACLVLVLAKWLRPKFASPRPNVLNVQENLPLTQQPSTLNRENGFRPIRQPRQNVQRPADNNEII